MGTKIDSYNLTTGETQSRIVDDRQQSTRPQPQRLTKADLGELLTGITEDLAHTTNLWKDRDEVDRQITNERARLEVQAVELRAQLAVVEAEISELPEAVRKQHHRNLSDLEIKVQSLAAGIYNYTRRNIKRRR